MSVFIFLYYIFISERPTIGLISENDATRIVQYVEPIMMKEEDKIRLLQVFRINYNTNNYNEKIQLAVNSTLWS